MAIASSSSQGGGGSKKAKIVVKQDMINFIKSQGMNAALKRAGEISAKGTKGEAEFLEGVKRMYGANRLAAATKAATPAAKKPTVGTRNRPVMVDAKGPNAIKPAATKTMYNRLTGEKITYTEPSKAASKPKPKKSTAAAPKFNRYTQQKIK